MESGIRDIIRSYTSSLICDLFAQQYIYEYGEKKMDEIVANLNKSQKVTVLLIDAIKVKRFFTSKEILSTLHVVPYFLFAKPETMCLGALAAVIKLEVALSAAVVENGENNFKFENSSLCCDIIMDCYKFKYKRDDCFFDRYLKRLDSFPPPIRYDPETFYDE